VLWHEVGQEGRAVLAPHGATSAVVRLPQTADSPGTADEVTPEDDAARAIVSECVEGHAAAHLAVTGDCMHPALRPGELVTLAPPAARPPRLGDVVLFRSPEGLRLHRLVWAPRPGNGRWRTKADAAAALDPWWLQRADVLGTVVAREDGDDPRSLRRAASSLLGGLLARFQPGES
jgi:hypothetical protein